MVQGKRRINFLVKKFMKRSCAAQENGNKLLNSINIHPACPIGPEDRIGVKSAKLDKFFGKKFMKRGRAAQENGNKPINSIDPMNPIDSTEPGMERRAWSIVRAKLKAQRKGRIIRILLQNQGNYAGIFERNERSGFHRDKPNKLNKLNRLNELSEPNRAWHGAASVEHS